MAVDAPKKDLETWYAMRAGAREPRPTLSFEIDVDVCVIGAGFAGLTVARELATRGWSVAVLEAGRIADAASGRGTGVVMPGFSASTESLVARVGLDHAKRLWSLSERGVDLVRQTIRGQKMRGTELTAGGWLHVSKVPIDAAQSARAQMLRDDFGVAVEAWPRERLASVLKSPHYFDALHYARAFSINPLAYAMGLAASAEAAGVHIYEYTPALELDPAGVRKRITTPKARVRAQQVVLAGNVQIGALAQRLSQTLIPVSTYALVTEPLGGRLPDAIATKAAVSDTSTGDNHYRVVGGDRLMWSGRSTGTLRDPRRIAKALIGDIARTYPQLGPVGVETVWGGTTGHTLHKMPQIGELAPGIWVLSGFGSQGLNTTAIGGELIARAIAENDTDWRLFEPFHLVWAGGRLGRAFTRMSGWTSARRERWAARRAQRRAPPLPVVATEPVAELVVDPSVEPTAPDGVSTTKTTADSAPPPQAITPRGRRTRKPARARTSDQVPTERVPVNDAPVDSRRDPTD